MKSYEPSAMSHQPRTVVRLGIRAFVLTGLLVPALAEAQQPTRRRQAPIEIRGQVPTPQVVTVRPREMPAYSRQVLVPRFFDHDFWPEIQLGYQMVPERQISGRTVSDTMMTRNDSSATPGVATPRMTAPTRPNFTPGSDSTRTPAVPPASADTTRRRPGTAPAR
jgi:hypothetical protein